MLIRFFLPLALSLLPLGAMASDLSVDVPIPISASTLSVDSALNVTLSWNGIAQFTANSQGAFSRSYPNDGIEGLLRLSRQRGGTLHARVTISHRDDCWNSNYPGIGETKHLEEVFIVFPDLHGSWFSSSTVLSSEADYCTN